MSFLPISSGKLIEYLDNGRFICGYVTESQAKRVRLLNQNGRELNLPISRIVHCSTSNHSAGLDREALIKLLKDTTAKRHSLMELIDLEILWDLTNEEANDTFDPHFLAELSFGCSADDDIVSAFLRSVFKDKLFFRYREGKIKVHSPDKVNQLRTQLEKENEKEVLIASGIELVTRIIKQKDSQAPFSPLEEEILILIQNFYLYGGESDNADIARKLLKESGLSRPHDPYKLLVKSGVWKKNINIPLLRHNL
ncbi:MAG: ribonuclease R, partial [Deltaproteobacteria bacterium]|nr:ribonuclease R [Deltaproteobacteria bacterium]